MAPAVITEESIDQTIKQELKDSSRFCQWFVEQAVGETYLNYINNIIHPRKGFAPSRDSNLGFSDIQLTLIYSKVSPYEQPNVQLNLFSNMPYRIMILVEDKIDSSLSTEQCKKYQLRREHFLEQNYADSITTVLIAPQVYLDHCNNSGAFDQAISYEDIKSQLSQGIEAVDRAILKAELKYMSHAERLGLYEQQIATAQQSEARCTSIEQQYQTLETHIANTSAKVKRDLKSLAVGFAIMGGVLIALLLLLL